MDTFSFFTVIRQKVVICIGLSVEKTVSCCAEYLHSKKHTSGAKKISIIYYLLSIIYYLKSPGCANGFCPSAPLGVTFVMRHKSNQKDFFGTAQEGIKMTALRGKAAFRFHCAYTLAECKTPLAETPIRYFFKPHSVMA